MVLGESRMPVDILQIENRFVNRSGSSEHTGLKLKKENIKRFLRAYFQGTTEPQFRWSGIVSA